MSEFAPEPTARCECGAMSETECGEMPGRHCGVWEPAEGLDERRRTPAPELFTHQPAGMTGYTFRIAWSTDDGEWVGTCDQLPSLSYLHHDPVEAAEWICSLVADYVDELDAKLNPVAPSSGCPFNGPHDFAPTDPCSVRGDRIAIVPLGKPVPDSRCVAPVRETGDV